MDDLLDAVRVAVKQLGEDEVTRLLLEAAGQGTGGEPETGANDEFAALATRNERQRETLRGVRARPRTG